MKAGNQLLGCRLPSLAQLLSGQLVAAAALCSVLITACQTMEQKGYVQNEYGDWIKTTSPYFANSAAAVSRKGNTIANSDNITARANMPSIPMPVFVPPAQRQAPQPIIVTSPGSGTTIANKVGNSTIVSQFGGYRPIGSPYAGGGGTTIATQVGNSTIISQFGGYRPIGNLPPPPINTQANPIYYVQPIQQP
jgi:hypothetical protein